jgi:hypothetical protein
MVAPRKISSEMVKTDPYVVWNEFVNLLAMSDYADLTPAQRGAHLVFWYESETQNGGHCQYFTNCGIRHLDELITALQDMSANDHARLLILVRDLLARATPKPEGKPTDEWVDDVLGDNVYDRLDAEFDKCRPTLVEALQKHLDSHEADFIERG